MNDNSQTFDVIVVGGSYAGMSAALQLVRAKRRVLILDTGEPRNRRARHAHGFMGRDGSAPTHIAQEGRSQLLSYPTVRWHEDRAVSAGRADGGTFQIDCESGEWFTGKRVVLAYGVRDTLPAITGLAERWGTSVFHCPYCHGYELSSCAIGVIACASDPLATQALLLSEWGHVTLFCTGEAPLHGEQLKAQAYGVEPVPIARISSVATVQLEDGTEHEMDALFVSPKSQLSTDLAEQLGCELEDMACIRTNAAKQTTVEGVYACGDAARASGSIALAVGEGALAGVAVHQSLAQP